jgi:DNA-binding NtrC family response regulator
VDFAPRTGENRRVVSVDMVLPLVLGNPYQADLRARRLALDEPDRLPQEPAAWQVWWKELPNEEMARPEVALAMCVGLTSGCELSEAAQRLRSASRSLTMLQPAEVTSALELAARARAVGRALDRIVGDTEVMRRVRERAWAAAFGESLDQHGFISRLIPSTPVLIRGETGTGKELVASALQLAMPGRWEARSGWRAAASETVHLAALPETLVESTLFGHVKGAFTDAREEKPGVLERCHGGAVFLDEVGELPLKVQVTLLRALQEGKVQRLGGKDELDAAPRILSATHQDLRQRVQQGSFRLDLYHRLRSVVIELPPLRERREDIPLLAEEEFRRVDPALRGQLKDRFQGFLETIGDYSWPGNVRELSAVVRTLALGLDPPRPDAEASAGQLPSGLLDGTWPLAEAERWYCQRVRDRSRGMQEAAERLGIDRGTLRKKLGEATA